MNGLKMFWSHLLCFSAHRDHVPISLKSTGLINLERIFDWVNTQTGPQVETITKISYKQRELSRGESRNISVDLIAILEAKYEEICTISGQWIKETIPSALNCNK